MTTSGRHNTQLRSNYTLLAARFLGLLLLRGVLVAIGVVGLPPPCARTHVIKAPFCLPPEVSLGLARICDHGGQISRPAIVDLVGDLLARGLLEGLHHIQDR